MLGLHTLKYRAMGGVRFGVGPVGDSWRDSIGISGVLFGRGLAIFHVGKDETWIAGPVKPAS